MILLDECDFNLYKIGGKIIFSIGDIKIIFYD